MSQKVKGNTRGLRPSEVKRLAKLFNRRVSPNELVTLELAREVYDLAEELGRKVGLLISREGFIEEVFVGERTIIYLPDIGRYRLGKSRLRRLRLLFSDLSKGEKVSIPADIFGDLEKLRLDAVISVKRIKNRIASSYAYLTPTGHSEVRNVSDLGTLSEDFQSLIESIEDEFEVVESRPQQENAAVLIHVSTQSKTAAEDSLIELSELARTASIPVLEKVIQKRDPDPHSVLGKGKLEEVILRCLRIGAEMLIFDCELKPAQWRAITNTTNLKIIDRSMLILDIFSQRAKTSEGALQVELAQLKYNLPRLVEKDAGLSRLIGGIGGRGPGETKLEIGRRRIRERISELEKRISTLQKQRALRREKRQESGIPLVAIIGYTNVGKSTLFNRLTGSKVIVEDKLFATLDPYQRRWNIIDQDGTHCPLIVSDTVGFVRDLPKELTSAFRATLEELYQAALILHVVDASDALIDQRIASVEKILTEMSLSDVPQIFVINKTDLAKEALDLRGIKISALKGTGIRELEKAVLEKLKNYELSHPVSNVAT